jgi:CheY-like chemotaxis protein
MIIDDNEIDRTVMAELLSSAGFEVHVLSTPIGATRLAKQKAVSVVVIDQNMPSMDGSKLALLFRGNNALRHTRLVLVSSDDRIRMKEVAAAVRADAFVEKSRIAQDLATVVTELWASAQMA